MNILRYCVRVCVCECGRFSKCYAARTHSETKWDKDRTEKTNNDKRRKGENCYFDNVLRKLVFPTLKSPSRMTLAARS